jgi:hypothetical protein
MTDALEFAKDCPRRARVGGVAKAAVALGRLRREER